MRPKWKERGLRGIHFSEDLCIQNLQILVSVFECASCCGNEQHGDKEDRLREIERKRERERMRERAREKEKEIENIMNSFINNIL